MNQWQRDIVKDYIRGESVVRLAIRHRYSEEYILNLVRGARIDGVYEELMAQVKAESTPHRHYKKVNPSYACGAGAAASYRPKTDEV